ncbi:MAG: transcriptional regulator [Chloroflexota bacterium]|nr:MAG: transcriptional regulator [Chloroflexota bacterium]
MEDLLIKAVRRLGVATSQELQRELGISQPTFSRLALRAAGQIAVLGRGRSTRYSLPRNVRGLGSEFPVLEIDANGNASQITRLRPIEGGRWWGRDPITREERLFGGFPYFLSDMRPQGFMGRAFPRRFAELELPERVADWSDDDVLLALARRGEDGMGNLIVGAESSQRYLQSLTSPPEVETNRLVAYPRFADCAMAGAPAGSSAGGEQPKFTALVAEDGPPRHVLVKFSPKPDSPADVRWIDLLFSEELALHVLREAGMDAVAATAVEAGGRAFLEIDRFDRAGLRGRVGTISLGAFDDEFYGRRDNWTAAAARMERDRWLDREEAGRLRFLDAFGALIGNSDRHFGNITLFPKNGGVALAPAYDVLPMHYAPISGQIVERDFSLPMPHSEALSEWKAALPLAEQFWSLVAGDPRISDSFRTIAGRNASIIAAGRPIARSLPDTPAGPAPSRGSRP